MWLSDLQITACRFKTEWWKGDLWVHPTHPSSVIVPKHVLQVVLDKIFAKSQQMQCNTCELWHKKPPTWIVVIIQHSCYNSGGITSSLCLRADPQANQKKALWDVKNIEPLIWPPIGCIFYVACHKSICRMKAGFFMLLFLDTGMQCHASHNFVYHPGNHLEKLASNSLFCCTVKTSSLPQLLACRQCDRPMQCKGLYVFLKGNTPPITTAASSWVGFFCESMAHVHSVLTDAYWLCLPCTCAGRSPDRSKSAAHTISPRKNFCLTLCLSLS